jgi:low temperature requirement protein LtrA
MASAALLVRPRLRSTSEAGRKVTWLELFFDLVFVAAVAQVAAPLRDDYTIAGLVRFTPLFLLIWWAWTGHSVFSNRFDTDDLVQRALTLLQMFAVAAMAANARDALDSRSSAGFAAAYAAVRFILVAQYLRARCVPGARALTKRYLIGHGGAAVIWLASSMIPAPARFAAWAIAFAIDLGTPWSAVDHSLATPVDSAHLPERFGLFTLILLGESVVAVMQGMESQETWPVAAAACAFLGMTTLFVIWWWYFDGAEGASERPIRSRADAIRFHIWSYAHFPLYLGIIVTGVGIERLVRIAAHSALASRDALLFVVAAVLSMAAMAVIAGTTRTSRRHEVMTPVLVVALLTALAAAALRPTGPLVVMIVVAAGFVIQLAVALRAQSVTRQ